MNLRGILFVAVIDALAVLGACSLTGCGVVADPTVTLTPSTLCGPTECLDVHFRRPRTDRPGAEWLSTQDLVMFELDTERGLIRQVPKDGWVNITPEKDAPVCSELLGSCGWVPYIDTRSTKQSEPPLGIWQDSHGNYAYVSGDIACGPLGHCETMIEVGPSFLLTEEGGQYSWSYDGETLSLCRFPCPVDLEGRETGEPYVWSELTNSYGWTGWTRLSGI